MKKYIAERALSLIQSIKEYDRRIARERQVLAKLADDEVRSEDKIGTIENLIEYRNQMDIELETMTERHSNQKGVYTWFQHRNIVPSEQKLDWETIVYKLAEIHDIPLTVSQDEMDTLEMAVTSLASASEQDVKIDSGLIRQAKQLQKVLSEEASFNNKLKLVIPIIPFLLFYQCEINLKNAVDLRALWHKCIIFFTMRQKND